MNKRLLAVITIAFMLGGCASGVTRKPDVNASANRAAPTYSQFSSVSVSLTNEAKAKSSENLKFNPDELLSYVKRALESKSLLNPSPDKNLPKLEIQVKDMRIRSNFSAIMWGFMAGADSIRGDIVLTDASGKELDRFEVSASYALGGLAGGQDSSRMSWLYEKFAQETVTELTKQQPTASR